MKLVSLILAHANGDDVNAAVSPRDGRTPLHLASSLGNLAMAQLLIWVSLIILGLLMSSLENFPSFINFKLLYIV